MHLLYEKLMHLNLHVTVGNNFNGLADRCPEVYAKIKELKEKKWNLYIKEGDATCGILFFRRLAYTCRQTCVRNSRGFVPSDRSSHSPLGERDFGREVGTLFYIWDEGTKAYYPYRMVDYCYLLGFQEKQIYDFLF